MIATALAQKWILYAALLLTFILPLSRAGINLLSLVLLVVWLIEGNFKEKFHTIINHKFTLALLFFLLYQAIILLWVEPENIQQAIKYSFKYVYFLIVFILVTSYPKEKAHWLLYALLAGMFISVLQSLSIYFDIYPFKEVNKESLSPHMWHTIYSLFLSFSSLMSLVLFLQTKEYRKKILFSILFIMITTVLFLGVSRTGQMIFILGIFLIMIRHYHLTWKSFLSTFIMITLLLTTLYTQNSLFKSRIDIAKSDINLLQKNNDYCTSIGGRIFTWEVAYTVFKKEPIFGLGTIDHIDFLKKTMQTDPRFSQCEIKKLIGYYHTQYLELLAQAGLVGLFLLLALFYTFSRITLKDSITSYTQSIFLLLFLSVFFLDVPFRKMFTLALFAIITSIILLQERFEREI